MTQTKNTVPIPSQELNKYRSTAVAKLRKGTIEKPLTMTQLSAEDMGVDFSIIDAIIKIQSNLYPNTVMSPLRVSLGTFALQEGLTMGLYMNDVIKKDLNIFDMGIAMKDPKYDDKRMSATAIGLFSWVSYTLYLINQLPVATEDFIKEWDKLDEIKIDSFMKGSDYILYSLCENLNKDRFITTDEEMVAFLKQFFGDIQYKIAQKKDLLESDNIYFEKRIYQLNDFSLNGWEIEEPQKYRAAFDDQSLDDIVGNARLKRVLKRLVTFLIAYDFKEEKNPFFEFGGGFSTVVFLFGEPGTGKTMFYRALATLLRMYAEKHKIPYQILDFPKDIVDSYQGASAKKAKEWFKNFNDTTKITLGGMDDCENMLVSRGGRDSSEGTNGVISVVLTETEGLQNKNKGRAILLGLTNKIGIIDPAVISRMGTTEEVKGPQGAEDFMDQTYLWFQKMRNFGSKVTLKEPSTYALMSRQKDKEEKKNDMAAFQARMDKLITDDELRIIYNDIKTYKHSGYDFIGQMTERFQKRYKNFAGRDLRNIHSSIVLRLLDFEFPDEWLENTNAFVAKTYNEKVELIQQLIDKSLNNISFEEIIEEETINYMNNFTKVGSDERNKKIKALVEDIRVSEAARAEIERNKSTG